MNLNIRLANINDIKDVFMLANDDIVRANSINTSKIKYDEHERWFKDKISSKDTIFYVLEVDTIFAGCARIDRQEDNLWLVSINILEHFRAKKLGYYLLKNICEQNATKSLLAYIKINNLASKIIFEKNDFVLSDEILINASKYYIFKRQQSSN